MAKSVQAPPPPGLQQALLDQNDLESVPGALGVQVFRNPEAIPITAQRARPVVFSGKWPGPARSMWWGGSPSSAPWRATPRRPVSSLRRHLRRLCPGREFLVTEGGRAMAGQPCSDGPGSIPRLGGTARLSLRRFPFGPLGVLVELLAWVVLALALLGWPGLRGRRGPARRASREPGP